MFKHFVKEPKIYAHELQQLPMQEVVCTYKGHVWKSVATPYYQLRKEGASDEGGADKMT